MQHEPTPSARPSAEELAKWSKLIGMKEELDEDLGATALLESIGEHIRENESDRAMRGALRQYFAMRAGDNPEEHKRIALEMAGEAGVDLNDLSMDIYDLIEQVRDEMEAIDQQMSHIATDLATKNPTLTRNAKTLSSRILLELERSAPGHFEHIDQDVLEAMAERVAEATAGY